MAFRLGEYVVYGELYNTRNYATHGVIVLRRKTPDEETVVRLDLTGNCGPDLQGRAFRFWPDEADASDAVFGKDVHTAFQNDQIGPTGTMTAQGWARMMPCRVDEYMRRAELGEPPPTEWKRRLYLEWYGQNGRVVVELAGAVVEECTRIPEDADDEGDWQPLPNLAPLPDATGGRPAEGPGIVMLRRDKDRVEIENWAPPNSHGSAEDTYESITDALQQKLDKEAAAIDRAIRRGSNHEDDDVTDEFELMDDCIEHDEGRPAADLLGNIGGLPRPETLNDEEVEGRLKVLLAQMACIGMALDVCEHFTPRDCYRLLLDTILLEPNVYERLIGTCWVQHVMTHEYCTKCDAEIDS